MPSLPTAHSPPGGEVALKVREAPKRVAAPVNRSAPRFQGFGEIISELRKVVWPSRPDTTHLTIVVISVSVAVGLLLGVVDFLFAQVVNLLLLR